MAAGRNRSGSCETASTRPPSARAVTKLSTAVSSCDSLARVVRPTRRLHGIMFRMTAQSGSTKSADGALSTTQIPCNCSSFLRPANPIDVSIMVMGSSSSDGIGSGSACGAVSGAKVFSFLATAGSLLRLDAVGGVGRAVAVPRDLVFSQLGVSRDAGCSAA